jgi:hypothetical protein
MAAFPRPTAFAVSLALLLAACGRTSSPSEPIAVPATTAPATARTPTAAEYEVSLRGSKGGTVWRGTQQVTFTNSGDAPLRRVWLRTWANGVQGCDPVAIEVSSLEGGVLGASSLACTAIPVTLAAPLGLGERTSLSFELVIRVPERNDRFGSFEGLALMGNALPTLAVHDDQGWHLDPYVDLGESFYSEVGRYVVSLDVSARLRTPATGSLVDARVVGDRVIRTYTADDVRDFAWGAGVLEVARGDADGVTVSVWYLPSFITASRAGSVVDDAVTAMTAYASAFGAYPYEAVDVVTAPFTAFGGMEYPRIVFTNPERTTLAHELAHQWWYGIVGDDQFGAPWLDESFATWASYLPWTPWRGCGPYEWPSARARLTNDMAYWRDHPGEYLTIYAGGGCMLADLADRFGPARFTTLLSRYARAHWLGVTTTPAFQRLVERAAARRLTGFDAEAYWDTWRVG